jgi:outer membrane lipoprotein carrier protein
MRKKFFIPALLALSVVFSGHAFAAEPAGPIMEKMQAAYAAMKSFRADFSQELTHQESGTTETRKGTLLFLKPLLVRWETADPTPELLMVTDKEIWNYLPDEDLAYRYSLEVAQDSRSIIMVITGQSPLDKDFDVERTADEGGLVHLLLYPKDPAPQLTEAQLWLDPISGTIRKATVMDFYGNTNTVGFDTLTPDAPVESSNFAFTPPEGTEVEDHIDDTQLTQVPLLN